MIKQSPPYPPDNSRTAFVHLKGIQGRSCTRLPQGLDNESNERMRFARRVKIFHEIIGLIAYNQDALKIA